jgi:hypothetical protein
LPATLSRSTQHGAEISTYRFIWQPVAPVTNDATQSDSVRILLFYHTPEFAETARRILNVGQLILVRIGASSVERESLVYEINGSRPEEYSALFGQLLAQHIIPTHVVYQGLTEGLTEGHNDPAHYRRNIEILHHCVAALKSAQLKEIQILLLYSGSASVDNAIGAAPYLEALGGYTRSLALAEITLRKICVAGEPGDYRQQLEVLATEIEQANDGHYHEILYQTGVRYIKTVAKERRFPAQRAWCLLDYRGCWRARSDRCSLSG